MDFAELRPDVNSESLIFTRVARLVCARARARESSARDSREGYNLPGERRTRERREAPGSLAPGAMYYLVLGTMGFVCKSFETRNQVERPPTSRAGCSGSSKGPEEREERVGLEIRAKVYSRTRRYIAQKRKGKRKRARTRGKRERWGAEPFCIMRRVPRVTWRRGK